MDDERMDDFRNKKEKIENQKNLIAETVDLKQSNIEKEAKTIGVLKQCENKYSYLYNMMDDVSEDQVLKMSDEEYTTFSNVFNDSTVSGEAFVHIFCDTKQSKIQYDQHYNMCASLGTACASAASGCLAVSHANPGWFPNNASILNVYQVVDELFEQIEFIRSYLKSEIPDVADDFEAFIDKYNAFKADSSKYQDLVGSRSMFFWKMIFDFSKQNYGVDLPRSDAIRAFVFGSTPPVPAFEPILMTCKLVYSDFSSQDDRLPSIKMGRVNPSYVDTMFRRLIGSIAQVLELRQKYFTL